MALNSIPVLPLGGGPVLFKTSGAAGGGDSDIGPTDAQQVATSANMQTVDVGGVWSVKVLESWLAERRDAGLILTKDCPQDWWYTTFVRDPQSELGYIFTLSDEGTDQQAAGEFAYAALWAAARVGVGLGALSHRMTTNFLAKNTRVDAARLAAKGARALNGLRSYTATDPYFWDKPAATSAIVTAGALLSGSNEAVAASSVEAFSAFITSERGVVRWFSPSVTNSRPTRIGSLANTDAVLAFKRAIMAHILNFQKRTISD